jgi:hypothetical protein
MKTLKATLEGRAPIMFHNERLANPLDPITRELKKLTSVKKKTDETLEEMMRIEWLGGLYLKDDTVVVPSDCVLATLKQAARKCKRGKDVESSVFCEQDVFPLIYDGPKDVDALFADARFRDYRGVGVNGKRVMRSRPIFRWWQLNVEVQFDPEIVNDEDLTQWFDIAGKQIGLCERRPRFGRFVIAGSSTPRLRVL